MAYGHAHDPVSQSQRLGLVVDIEHGGLQALMQQQDLPAGGAAELASRWTGAIDKKPLGLRPMDGPLGTRWR